MADRITVVIADDHPIYRKGLIEALSAEPAFQIVGEAGDGEAALAMIRQHKPSIALLDIEMPLASGLVVTGTVRREGLPTAIIMLTMYTDAAMFRRALDLGARGYVLKDGAVSEIVACIHMVAAGRPFISPALSGALLRRQDEVPTAQMAALALLTRTERRVLQLVVKGMSSAGIAEELGNSTKTVENFRSRICHKLGLQGPQSLLRFALENKALLE